MLSKLELDTSPITLGEDDLAWLRAFERRKGRKLRVLHVGNIANNAYLNAKFLRTAGVEAHVLSYDYYHVMAMPEWEDVELRHPHGDDYYPKFADQDLRSYRRPSWFVNVPLLAAPVRISELCGDRVGWWRRLGVTWLQRLLQLFARLQQERIAAAIQLLIMNPPGLLYRAATFLATKFSGQIWLKSVVRFSAEGVPGRSRDARRRCIALFDAAFPQRRDRLEAGDIIPFQASANYLRQVFCRYDVVQCYATAPIYACLAGQHPYVAFEHGTLRAFTTDDLPLHRMTALGYRQADHTFITNGDCLAYAKRLGITSYSPVIHPVDVEQHRRDFGDAIAELRREIDADVILFCPLRHDWKIKGTDVHLRALPLIKKKLTGRVKLVLTRWGQEIADSEALLERLGCAEDVLWRPSMCRITMIKYIRAADVVLDQMALPPFGATAPQSIAAGTPVISSYQPESTCWMFPEPAPILPAFSPEEVAAAVIKATDPAWLADYKKRAQSWTDRYHHPHNIVRDHLRVYKQLLKA